MAPPVSQTDQGTPFALQSKEEMAASGANPDLRSATRGLQLLSPGALSPGSGSLRGFQLPGADARQAKFRSSDSFSERGPTPVRTPVLPYCMSGGQ